MPQETDNLRDAQDTLQIILELSNLLKTGLEPEVLMTCIRLCDEGIPPEVLSYVITEIKREATGIIDRKNSATSTDRSRTNSQISK